MAPAMHGTGDGNDCGAAAGTIVKNDGLDLLAEFMGKAEEVAAITSKVRMLRAVRTACRVCAACEDLRLWASIAGRGFKR